MLKIQEFAELCCCTTQTLRYYDRVHLFKPYYIEKVTGYRYYQENQIYEYYKIKQLQNAGFSIKEIKQLKGKDDDFVLEAIENKIEEQIEQLSHSIEILRTYQEENMKISEMLESLFNKKKLFVEQKDNTLHLKLKGKKAQLHFKQDPIAIARLLQVMQDNVLIGLDDLDDLNAIQIQEWNSTKVYHGWKDIDELLNSDIPAIPTDEDRTVFHLFHISKDISFYDINDVIQALVPSGYDGHLLYNVSISESGKNTYAIIYSEE